MDQGMTIEQARSIGRSMASNAVKAGMRPPAFSRDEMRVTAVRPDGRLDLDNGSEGHPMPVKGVPMTTACEDVMVGDTVVVDTFMNKPLVTGVICGNRRYVVLFDNQNASWDKPTILTESAANFRAILVEFEGPDRERGSTYVSDPDGRQFDMTTSLVIGSYWRVHSKRSEVSGSTINTHAYNSSYCTGQIVGGSSSMSDPIRIVKVTGIR